MSQSGTSKQTLYYIPHTHWEGAVFFTREEYLDMGLPHVLTMLNLMKKYPEYTFALDQVACIKPFLERYPEEVDSFRKFVKEGRLQIVGGMDVMPDDVKPGGELFVRQMMYGKRYCREALGVDVTVAWMLDTFGHHPQMPQLLTKAGFKSFWFCRGVPTEKLPSEFNWRGIDGTQIPAFWLPGFYGLFYGPPRDQPNFARFFQDRFNSLNPHARGPERVGLAGVDVSDAEDYVTPLVRKFNEKADAPFTIRYSVPTDFAKVAAARKDVPVFSFDLNPIFQGTYTSRIELKQTTREIEQKLLTAEKLGALSNWLGTPTDDKKLWQAWEPVLFNQTHDLASGVMADHVYADTVHSFAFSKRLADEMIADRWQNVSAHIDTAGPGVPVVVFNTLSWPRTDTAEVIIAFTEQGVRGVNISGPGGESVTSQIVSAERYSDGGIKEARIRFVAKDVPALGYTTYRITPESSADEGPTAAAASGNSIENDFYRVKLDLKTGAITSIIDKAENREVLSAPANIVTRKLDKGDSWEPYHTLDGASHIAMTTIEPVPTSATAKLSSDFAGKEGTIRRGPVFSEFSVTHPLANGSFSTKVRLHNGIKRIDIETDLVNNEKYVRYHVLFPTSIKGGTNTQEIPFGSVDRPIGIEFPAQHWVDYSDGKTGLALLNNGNAGNLVSDNTLMLSLLRSHSLGDYNEGHTSDSGFELGVPRNFKYALVPHAGNWQDGKVYRQGLEFNHPLIVRKVALHGGDLPKKWGMVEISEPSVVLTAFKPGPGNSTVLRVYEASGKETRNVKVKLNARVTSANEANLLEDSGKKILVRDSAVQFDLHPFEIKTIKLHLTPEKRGR